MKGNLKFSLSRKWFIALTTATMYMVHLAFADGARAPAMPWQQTPGISLQISIKQQNTQRDKQPTLEAAIVNKTKTKIILVEPGDGSNKGWRTPLTSWSLINVANIFSIHPGKLMLQPGRYFCGNINPLRPEEVFEIEPGQRYILSDSIYPIFPPGMYRTVLYYQNAPSLAWKGEPLGEHDQATMKRVRHSTPCSLISNEILITIPKADHAAHGRA